MDKFKFRKEIGKKWFTKWWVGKTNQRDIVKANIIEGTKGCWMYL